MSKPQHIGAATLYTGDCLDVLRTLPDAAVNCCITSPPYYGLRDYGVDGQIGLEATPDEYVAKLVEIFREVRRVLADDGTLWLNLGDSYAGARGGGQGKNGAMADRTVSAARCRVRTWQLAPELSGKNLIGIPWRVALALQADGWYLRQDIIWHKPNPIPESVRDRCTKAHEYIFLLSKSARYFYDYDAIAEPLAESSIERVSQPNHPNQIGSDRVPGKTNGPMKAVVRMGGAKYGDDGREESRTKSGNAWEPTGTRNRRSVWTVATQPYKEAHFATFPPALIEPCVLAGCPAGGTVLDPFSGRGTTGLVALQQGRKYIGIELNPEYQKLAVERITPAASQERLFA